MRASRLPVLVLVIAALVLAALSVRTDTGDTDDVTVVADVRTEAPMAAPADALSSTWYCAAGSAGDVTAAVTEQDATSPDDTAPDDTAPDDTAADDAAADDDPEAEPTGPVRADHAITITNLGGEERTASVSIQPGTSEPVIIEVQVPPTSSETIDLVDHAQGPAVAALVEVDGGDVAVSHQHVGDTGIDSGPCASSSSDVWHFAWGDTSVDAAEVIALFNPFPGAAVVDLRFSTADGIREPRALTGLVVPGHSVIVADVSAEVTRRDQVAATVTARSGRVVAERIQVADGTERANDLPTRLGLAVDLGTPAPALMWAHPHARFSATTGQQVVVYNPTDEPAEVDVEVALDDDVVGGVEPFQLSVRPRSAETIRLADEPRLADVFGEDTGRFSLVIRSVNGVPVVAEVVTTLATPGWTASPGGNVVGTTTVFGAPNLGEPSSNQLVLSALHADEPTVVRLVAFVDGEREVVEEVSIDPGSRLEIDLGEAGLDADADALVVESSAPVAVELLTIWPDPGGLSIRTGVVRFDGAVRVFDLLG